VSSEAESVSPTVEQCSDQGSTANHLELAVESEGEKIVAESKPLVVETNGIQSSNTTPPAAGSNNIVDSQLIEPLQETKKSGFLFFFCNI